MNVTLYLHYIYDNVGSIHLFERVFNNFSHFVSNIFLFL